MTINVFEIFGCTVYNMRRAAAKWPRVDGGRWCVRVPGGGDAYARTLLGAVCKAWWSANDDTPSRP
jgi:hypothetical protein